MTITARNYAAQAERALREIAELLPPSDADRIMLQGIAEHIAEAQHFVLPDNAVILDDELKGIRDQEVRLPYKTITVEYFSLGNNLKEGQIHAPKRVVLASEVQASKIKDKLPYATSVESEYWILFFAACFIEGAWVPIPTGWAMPCKWDAQNTHKMSDQAYISGMPLAAMPKTQKDMLDRGADPDDMLMDIVSEVRAVMELLEALSCSNVRAEPIERVDQSKNARRIRDGKLPIYETKMLVIDAPATRRDGVKTGGTHASPRQHLRRGHIRRLQDGRKIWVNACIVGSSEHGTIDKAYAIRRAA